MDKKVHVFLDKHGRAIIPLTIFTYDTILFLAYQHGDIVYIDPMSHISNNGLIFSGGSSDCKSIPIGAKVYQSPGSSKVALTVQACFRALNDDLYLGLTDTGPYVYLVKANEYEVVDDSKFELEGGNVILTTGGTGFRVAAGCNPTQATVQTGLAYPTQTQAEAAAKDIARYCRMRRLAEMVNEAKGLKDYMVQSSNGRWEICSVDEGIWTVDKNFTREGAKKACELLNSGRFSLDG